MTTYRELMIGCGSRRTKDLRLPTAEMFRRHEQGKGMFAGEPSDVQFHNLVTLDINPNHEPDIVCDLSDLDALDGRFHAYHLIASDYSDDGDSFRDNSFDEIHAYEVLEHIGTQGNARLFFDQFAEFHRILKPGGFFFGTCPAWCSPWAWGDPSHTRIITAGTLAFLSQSEYQRQVGVTPMSDFRNIYKADFEPLFIREAEAPHSESLLFVLRAVK